MHNTLSKATDIRRPHQRIHGCRSKLAQTGGTSATQGSSCYFFLTVKPAPALNLKWMISPSSTT